MGGGNSGRKWSGSIEIEVEAGEIALLLLLHLVDLEFREEHPAFGVVGVGQGQEAGREEVAGFDLVGSHFRELVPGNACGSLTRTPCWTGLLRDMVTPGAGGCLDHSALPGAPSDAS